MLDLFEDQKKPIFSPTRNFTAYLKVRSSEERTALFQKILEKYVLSASHLNRYHHCARSFMFECFLKVKYPPSKAMVRGTVVHSILEWIFYKRKLDKFYPEESDIITQLNVIWSKQLQKHPDIVFEAEEYKYVQHLVLDYFETHKYDWNLIVLTEFHVRKAIWNDIPMTGFIDKIEFDGRNVNVVDYKTGNIAYALAGMEEGGNYWRQLLFYAVLLEIKKPQWNVDTIEMCMISQNEEGNYVNKKQAVTEKDKALLKEDIASVYSKIVSFDFDGCKKKDCYWCSQPF